MRERSPVRWRPAPVGGVVRHHCYDARLMSDHTERLDKIAERISAAKEFL
jgi:hypothetical protein